MIDYISDSNEILCRQLTDKKTLLKILEIIVVLILCIKSFSLYF